MLWEARCRTLLSEGARELRGSGLKTAGEKRLVERIPAAGRIASLAGIGSLADRTAGRYLFQDTQIS